MNWQSILLRCGVRSPTVARWAPVFAAEIDRDTFSMGAAEIPVFLGQILHESAMLTRIEENLNYSTAERICAVWPSRFRTVADAAPYVRNSPGLANKVYGGRMGNMQPNDGWRYRGRGLIQITGRANYAALGAALGLALLDDPDMLLQPAIALRASVAWWEGNVPDLGLADARRTRRAVNGGTVGLEDTVRLAEAARQALA